MNEKVLIFSDRHKRATFEKAVNEAIADCNTLINIFEEFQPFMRIYSLEDAEMLIDNPGALFDQLLIENIEIKAAPGMAADPGQLAQLFSLERDSFLNLTAGKPVQIENCTPCKKMRLKPGKAVISPERYAAYKAFMNFAEGEFTINEEAVRKHEEAFDTYASTPQQLQTVSHYHDLVRILNLHDAKYPIQSTHKEMLTKIFSLDIEHPPFNGAFLINSEHLKNLISR